VELLSARERQVVALAALGQPNKMIAYELGIATSTVGVLLMRASRKVGAKIRRQLVAAYEKHRASG
jgi:DNA-binding CsgD family transcriptional regulator